MCNSSSPNNKKSQSVTEETKLKVQKEKST